jgi:hypothetical protein
MHKTKWLVMLLVMLGVMVAPVAAQTNGVPPLAPAIGQDINPNANISWPPPVYVLRGEFEIRGSVNLPSLSNYYIEYRPYNADLTTAADSDLWFPVSLPSNSAVQNDVLATWDTTVIPDGVYELRLTVNTAGNTPILAYVRPIRVENEPPPFVTLEPGPAITLQPGVIPTLTLPAARPTATATVPPPPTQVPPTIAPTQDPTPRATINVGRANVRSGDSTLYNIITSYAEGTSFPIVGISASGTGWFLIQQPNGNNAWVAPSVVTVTGNTASVPRILPPPPPVTPTPIPTATPITQANLVAGIVQISPSQPVCGQTFNVGFDVANLGATATLSGGIVSLQDIHNGSVQESTIGGFPVLNPGQTFRVQMPLTVDTFYDETHTLVLIIDPQNQVPETNESDNRREITYTLAKGGCP